LRIFLGLATICTNFGTFTVGLAPSFEKIRRNHKWRYSRIATINYL